MDLSDDKVRNIQISMTLRKLPAVIKAICPAPKGLVEKLLCGTDTFSKKLLQSIDDGLNWYDESVIDNDKWLKKALLECCGIETAKDESQQLSLLAEIDAFLQLCFCFGNEAVEQVPENGGKNGKTPDFSVSDDLYVEVYCPDESADHKESVSELNKQLDSSKRVSVATVISRPITGNKPLAKKFSANQTIARLISDKRAKDQSLDGKANILWLNLSNKLDLCVLSTFPVRSASKDGENTIGSIGLWHGFYGKKGDSVFGFEGHTLRLNNYSSTYEQRDYNGLFRERTSLSAAIIQCSDGVVIFQNPWAAKQLVVSQFAKLFKINQFRPEYSWVSLSAPLNLESRVEEQLDFANQLYRGFGD